MTRLAVIGGDGIGPEVISVATAVLSAVANKHGLAIALDDWDLGADRYLREGITISDEERDRLLNDYDAALLGALGDPRVPDNAHARDILLGLRFHADLFINYRPCKLVLPSLSPLKAPNLEIDLAFFRENTEGLYAGVGGRFKEGTPDEIAVQESLNTFKGVERIVRAAFQHANANARSRVTMVDKANALPHEGALWRRVFAQVGAEFPEIAQEVVYVDAMAMELVRRPERYQVIVTSNLFGDILSDLGAQIVGGLGLAASANLNPESWSLFEPVHGSAPDIAGTGRANPLAAVGCVALALEYLGYSEAAAEVDACILAALQKKVVTPDLGGSATTSQVGDWMTGRLVE